MQVLSDDQIIIDELYDYLYNKNIKELKRIEVPKDNQAEDGGRPMDGLVETVLSIGANTTTNIVNLALIYAYIKHNYPEVFEIVLTPIKKLFSDDEPLSMTYEEYEQMSDNAKKAVSENYDVLLKKKSKKK